MKYVLPISLAMLLASFGPVRADTLSDQRDVGVGLAVGVATGPNIAVDTSRYSHVAVGLGLERESQLRVQLDHAWHLNAPRPDKAIRVPVYLGLGAYLVDRKFGPTDLGVRMPIGLQVEFARAPLQLFGEIAPELRALRYTDTAMEPPSNDLVRVTGLAGLRATF